MKKYMEILKKNESVTPSKWRERAEWRRENRGWLKKSQHIALSIMDCMDDLKMNQKELAEKMGVTPQYISKILKGTENLSLETISWFEQALGMDIITLSLPEPKVHITIYQKTKYIELKTDNRYANIHTALRSSGCNAKPKFKYIH